MDSTSSFAQSANRSNHSFAGVRKGVEDLCKNIAKNDFINLPARRTSKLLAEQDEDFLEEWTAFQESWNLLEQDGYMRDGGSYRYRRHATFHADPLGVSVELVPHQPHYQSLDYNQLNGDIARHFSPIDPGTINNRAFLASMRLCCEAFGQLTPFFSWHIEAHQFRIYAKPGQNSSPTPEGVHRDGVNFVFMMLINRVNVVNGETSIHDRQKRRLTAFTLTNPMDVAIVNDERVMHGVTPIIQLDTEREAYRDVLVITFNKK